MPSTYKSAKRNDAGVLIIAVNRASGWNHLSPTSGLAAIFDGDALQVT